VTGVEGPLLGYGQHLFPRTTPKSILSRVTSAGSYTPQPHPLCGIPSPYFHGAFNLLPCVPPAPRAARRSSQVVVLPPYLSQSRSLVNPKLEVRDHHKTNMNRIKRSYCSKPCWRPSAATVTFDAVRPTAIVQEFLISHVVNSFVITTRAFDDLGDETDLLHIPCGVCSSMDSFLSGVSGLVRRYVCTGAGSGPRGRCL